MTSMAAAVAAGAQTPEPPPPLYPAQPAPPPGAYPAPAAPASAPPAYPSNTTVVVPQSAPPPQSTVTVRSDESRDSGLGLEWIWLNADVGASWVGLDSFNSKTLALQHASSEGPAFGLAAGVRLLFLTLGVRARDLQLAQFNLWEIDAEAAFHMRVDRIDPYFGVRGGYAFVGTFRTSAVQAPGDTSSPDVGVHGYNAGLMLGADYYFVHFVSLGLDLNPEVLFLKRPPAGLPPNLAQLPAQEQATIKSSPLYQQSGSSIGFGFTGSLHLGIHF